MTSGVAAQDADRVVGEWLINTKSDRFNDGQTRVIVMTTIQNGATFAARCMKKILSFALTDNTRKYNSGDIFKIALRADHNPVVDTLGEAADKMLQIDATDAMLRQVRDAREFSLRVGTGVYNVEYTFKAAGAKTALEPVFRECGISPN